MHTYKIYIQLLSLIIVLVCNGFAQKQNFRNYSIEDGLSQSVVLDIYQDSRGYIWFATDGGGVSQFNGMNFFTLNEKNGLCHNRITGIVEDNFNRIWFASDGGGVSIYDGSEIKNLTKKNGLSDNYIRTITKDEKNHIWLGTGLGATEIILDSINGTINKINTYNAKNGLTDQKILTIYLDKNNSLWFGTKSDGLYRKKGEYFTHYNTSDGLHNNTIYAIIEDKNNVLWIGTEIGAGKFIPFNNKSFITKFISYTDTNNFTNSKIIDIIEDKSGNIWFGTAGNGLLKYNGNRFEHYTEEQGLTKNFIQSLYEDKAGILWIGTYAGGAVKYDGGVFSYLNDETGLPNNIIFSIIQDTAKNYWFGTYGGGLAKYNPKNNTFYYFNQSDGLTDNRIYDIHIDKNNNIWIGTIGGGANILILDKTQTKIIEIIKLNETNGINDQQILSVFGDSYGNIWLGSYEYGLYQTKLEDKNYYNLKFNNFNYKDGFTNDKIYDIYEDRQHNLWFTSYGSGIFKISAKHLSDKIKKPVAFTNYTTKDGLGKNKTITLVQDIHNQIWIGTSGGGISKFNGQKFANYSTEDGIISDNIYLMVFDNENNLWIGTENGVDKLTLNTPYLYNKQTNDIKSIKHYGLNEGFKGYECNGRSVLKDHNGLLWFGTIDGINIYNPKADKVDNTPPLLHITSIDLFYKKTDWAKYSDSLTNWFNLPKHLELPSKKNHLTFHFTGINYTNPENVMYQYMLEGFDNDWSPVTQKTSETYTNIPPGDYIFKVKARNSDGFWNETPQKFYFTIHPPFTQTVWFYLIVIIVFLFIIYFFIKLRERSLLREKHILEEKVELRTMELRNQKENVEKQKEEILKQNKQIEAQRSLLEKKNTSITDSIDYAKRIQVAILPSNNYITRLFENNFVFYQPKDIIGGDFYWFHQIEHIKLFAVVDCTGHGVPGALMSIVGNNLLDQAVKIEGLTNPSEILKSMNKRITAKLTGNMEASLIKDGMDIGLCAYNEKEQILHFAGAYHKLYLIRNKELIEFKGDRIAVDVASQNLEDKFTTYDINIEKNDIIYMFTDGYVDQVGGKKRRKFYYKQFKDLLINIHELDMKEQKEKLHKEIIDWQGSHERFDDILIIGVKF